MRANPTWTTFALENEGKAVLPERVIGRPLWSFVADATTRQLYRAMVKKARAGERLAFPFRCDSPSRRRFMEMHDRGGEDGEVEFAARLLRLGPPSASSTSAGPQRSHGPHVQLVPAPGRGRRHVDRPRGCSPGNGSLCRSHPPGLTRTARNARTAGLRRWTSGSEACRTKVSRLSHEQHFRYGISSCSTGDSPPQTHRRTQRDCTWGSRLLPVALSSPGRHDVCRG